MSDESPQGSPFSRPGFVVAAVVLGVVLVAGGVVVGRALTADADARRAPTAVTSAPTTPGTGAPAAHPDEPDSICGLPGVETSGTVSTAPVATWEFQGSTAYPTSPEFGPAAEFDSGVRYCFQHSPEGALFAAANAFVQGIESGDRTGEFLEYFVSADVAQRDELIRDASVTSDNPDTRTNIEAFRVLAYDGSTARVAVVGRVSRSGESVLPSAIYDLVWEEGDWRLSPQDVEDPLQLAQLPDTAGYVAWVG